jgi:UDP-glucuronate 4-epimerase
MKNYIVTGGAGFIGSHLIDALLGQGDTKVTCIDNFDAYYPAAEKMKNIRHALQHPHFRLIREDITDLEKMAVHLSNGQPYDAIVHLAAKAGVRSSLDNAQAYYHTNVIGTINMLELARKLRIGQFVFTSSSSVYGISEAIPWAENTPSSHPISPYAASKLSGEIIGQVYAHLYQIRFMALRLFTVYGPRQRPDLAINKFIRLIRSHLPVPLYGNGSTYRDYTFVGDAVAGMLASLKYTDTMFEVFNIGSGQPVSLKELISLVENLTDQKALLNYLPDQPGDVRYTYADIAKARQLLDYEPKTSLATGIGEFIAWKHLESTANYSGKTPTERHL